MSILFKFWIFIKSIIDQAEGNTFVDGDKNKVNDKHKRKEQTEFQRSFFKLQVHKIKDDEICFYNCECDEGIKQYRLWNTCEGNCNFKNGYQKQYPKYTPDYLSIEACVSLILTFMRDPLVMDIGGDEIFWHGELDMRCEIWDVIFERNL